LIIHVNEKSIFNERRFSSKSSDQEENNRLSCMKKEREQ
jgi:hypothetical protein